MLAPLSSKSTPAPPPSEYLSETYGRGGGVKAAWRRVEKGSVSVCVSLQHAKNLGFAIFKRQQQRRQQLTGHKRKQSAFHMRRL